MEKLFYLQPRQTGKSTKALYEYSKDEYNTVFVTVNMNLAKNLCYRVKGNIDNFITPAMLINNPKRYIDKIFILDEYLLFEDKDKVYKLMNELRPRKIIIFSTANKVYNDLLFRFIKLNKHKMSIMEVIEFFKVNFGVYGDDWINKTHDLYYNFISDLDVKLIDKYVETGNRNLEELKRILPEDVYKIEILNQYIE